MRPLYNCRIICGHAIELHIFLYHGTFQAVNKALVRQALPLGKLINPCFTIAVIIQISPLRNMACNTTAPLVAWIVCSLKTTFTCALACLDSQVSSGFGSLNQMYQGKLLDDQWLQYWDTMVLITWHQFMGTILSCFICMIFPYTNVSIPSLRSVAAQASGSNSEYDSTMLLRLVQS
jgi:hypothetical protein